MNKHLRMNIAGYFLFLMAIMMAGFQPVMAQEKLATGVVVDANGEPMIGVTVSVKGTGLGTVTDLDGNFSLKVPEKSVVLFSFIGYANVEKRASELNNLKIVLREDTEVLEEVVVVAYGSQKKETLTGSISQVKSDELVKSPIANMGQALTGRAAGVTTYQQSGEPGNDDVTLRIRGTGTLNDASPLVLVDGVERSFSQIDPSEIESMSILKDAASTAVFGIRGANGVILITTKKGVEGPAKVSFSANFALQQPTRMPETLDGVTLAKMYNEAKYNDDPSQLPSFTENDLALYASGADPLTHPNINWKDYLMRKAAFQQKYNLTISGGTKNAKYYAAVAFLDQGGLMKDMTSEVDNLAYSHNYNYRRVNLRSNLDISLSPTTTIKIGLGGIIGNKVAPPDIFSSIIQSAAIAGGVYDRKLIILPNIPWGGSPLSTLLGSITDNNQNTINTNISFNQKLDFITKGLLLRGMASYDSYYSHVLNKGEDLSIYRVEDGYNEYDEPTKVLVPAREDTGMLPAPSESWDRMQSMHGELALEYKRDFNGHSVGALLLGTLDKKFYKQSLSTGLKQYTTVPLSYAGIVGRVTYDYKMKYLLEFNMGYNGSENFAKGKRFAWFPAVSVGWNVTEEKFIQELIDPSILSKLKLRASYGVTGNDNTNGFRFMYISGEYKSGGGAYFGDPTPKLYTGYVEGKLGNPDVTWETASKQNYGIDLGLFNNRLAITAEYFYDDRKNILATRYTEPTYMAISGQDVYNIGRVKNSGFEVEGRWNHSFSGFSYHVGGNFSYAHSEIVEDGSIKDPNNPHLWTTGHPVGVRWGYQFEKFYSTEEDLKDGPHLGVPALGEAKYVDVNRDGKINTDDYVPIGYPEIPEINYGFSGGFSYKGFDFSFLFQGAARTTKYLDGIFRRPFEKNQGMPSFIVDERWTEETAETAKRPKLTLAYTSMSYENSTLWARDGSYLKLRNVELGYTFNKNQLNRLFDGKVQSIRIYLNGQNLYTWDKLKFVDPESKTSSYSYPQLRVFNAGLSLNF